MSDTFAPFSPQNGQLPNIQGNIISCPNGTNYYVKRISLFNNNPATQTIFLYVLPNGGSVTTWHCITLAFLESAEILEGGESETLTPGDAIQAVTTTVGAVDYTISGVQET